nr:peroxisomal membrane protein PEX14 isoform X1 [Tanacetum cinerariifolium]
MDIMSMIQRGERPPNIRPWEAAQSQGSSAYPQENSNVFNSYGQDNGSGPASIYQSNGEGSAPWWQQKNARVTEIEPEENKTGYPGGSSERPIQRSSWVPPQPPPVAMAEAAAAIRQPKKSPSEKEQQLTDDQFLARSTEFTDELQRVTKISESGGVPTDVGSGSSVMGNTSEIQTEEEATYYEA